MHYCYSKTDLWVVRNLCSIENFAPLLFNWIWNDFFCWILHVHSNWIHSPLCVSFGVYIERSLLVEGWKKQQQYSSSSNSAADLFKTHAFSSGHVMTLIYIVVEQKNEPPSTPTRRKLHIYMYIKPQFLSHSICDQFNNVLIEQFRCIICF